MNPFAELPDFDRLSEREMMLLLLLEISELRAEARAQSSLLLSAHRNVVHSSVFDKILNAAQDDVLKEMIDHARRIKGGGQIPGNQ